MQPSKNIFFVVFTQRKKDAKRRPFCVGWGTGVPSVAPHTVGVAELGSHLPLFL